MDIADTLDTLDTWGSIDSAHHKEITAAAKKNENEEIDSANSIMIDKEAVRLRGIVRTMMMTASTRRNTLQIQKIAVISNRFDTILSSIVDLAASKLKINRI